MNSVPALAAHARDTRYHYAASHSFSPEVEGRSRLFTAALPCLTGIGMVYQALATARDERDFPPPGSLVDVGECRLHLQVAGSGSPTVLLESGLGGMSSAWAWVFPEAARLTRVVAYDRAGLGWSQVSTGPKTAALTVERLRAALRQLGIEPPYLLVGHSMGGLFARVFAAAHPDEVAGMVLLDAVHPDQHLVSPAIGVHMRTGFRFLKVAPLLARLGYIRFTRFFGSWSKGLPPLEAAQADAFLCSHRHLATTRDESLAWEVFCQEVRRGGDLGDLPLAVLSAAREVLPGQPELQQQLAALSTDASHTVVNGADHVTLVTRRRYAMSIVDAIRQLVERLRR